MAVTRPTFHESWYRVAPLKPRLRATVRVSRQFFRGRQWYVLQDQANNAFFRLNRAAYRFIGLLDGRRTVETAWEFCGREYSDEAPTQPEAIQLLAQLASSNLLEVELAPDTQGMFERFRKRRRREMQNRMMNLLFPRFPLLDPDLFLDHVAPLIGWIFTWPGLTFWLALLAAGVYSLLNQGPGAGHLLRDVSTILRPDNWLLLYAAFIVDKICHEFGHAIACKKFGRDAGGGGEVHVIGLMLLVFTPVPYVDASSAWLLPSRWRRAVVGAAGMWVELALASIAAILWVHTSPNSTLHAFCYNLMFIASVATVIFNGNPFLRYDGYYILSDLVEIPNLLGRSLSYAAHLIKRYIWTVPEAIDPSETWGQRIWLLVYLAAAGVVRVLVSLGILIFLVRSLHNYPQIMLPVAVMVVAGFAAWVIVPLGRCVWYLAASPELSRRRSRAVITSLAGVLVLLAALGLWPAPDHCRVEGVVRPVHASKIFARTAGFIDWTLPTNTAVHGGPRGTVLLRLRNPSLAAEQIKLQSQLAQLVIRRNKARAGKVAMEQILTHRLRAVRDQLANLNHRIAGLTLRAPIAGRWIAPKLTEKIGGYLQQGQPVGRVASQSRRSGIQILAAASQDLAARVINSGSSQVQIRPLGRPGMLLRGGIIRILPAGQSRLPSAALGYTTGGPIAINPQDATARRAAEPYFELFVRPRIPIAIGAVWLSGQRVMVRIALPAKPLLWQGWNALHRLLNPQTGT